MEEDSNVTENVICQDYRKILQNLAVIIKGKKSWMTFTNSEKLLSNLKDHHPMEKWKKVTWIESVPESTIEQSQLLSSLF